MFYLSWCPHCQEMMPVWNKLADTLGKDIKFAAIDIHVNDKIANAFKVNSVPRFFFFSKDDYMYKFSGKRSFENLEKFAT